MANANISVTLFNNCFRRFITYIYQCCHYYKRFWLPLSMLLHIIKLNCCFYLCLYCLSMSWSNCTCWLSCNGFLSNIGILKFSFWNIMRISNNLALNCLLMLHGCWTRRRNYCLDKNLQAPSNLKPNEHFCMQFTNWRIGCHIRRNKLFQGRIMECEINSSSRVFRPQLRKV